MSMKKKTAGIILAAGTASRMGKTKQLLPFMGTTLLGRVLENVLASNFFERILVLGHEAGAIQTAINLSGFKITLNPEYAKGQSTSLIKGILELSPSCDGAMFLLSDQPLVTSDVINRILAAFEVSSAPILIPFYRGQRGNPVIISRALFPKLLSLSKDTGARAVFDEFKDAIEQVNLDTDAILLDVDTPADYAALLSRDEGLGHQAP